MFSRYRTRNSAITFDVGTAGIRAFQVAGRGSRVSGRDALRLQLPLSRERGDEVPRPDYSRIVRLVGQGDFVGSDVAIVLSPPEVRFCALKVPKKALTQPDGRVREVVAWEVAREMRADVHELEVRYWELPPGHQQSVNVMAVALPIERALTWFRLFARDQLRLRRIDVSPCALVHLGCRMSVPRENELWGVLDLGYRRATLTVALGNVPVYIRLLPVSSDAWTRSLAEAFEVGYAAAEQIKRTQGIRPVERGIRPPQPDQPLLNAEDIPHVVFGLLRESLDDLVSEINKCFAYVMQNFPDVNATRLLLAGGGANLGGLTQYLETELGLSVGPLEAASAARAADWERPLTDITIQPEASIALGGAVLDLELG